MADLRFFSWCVCSHVSNHSLQSLLDGDKHEQIKGLLDYRLELLRAHPTSTVMFKCTEGKFEGMHVCLTPLKVGFLAGCRQIISLNGCFPKGLFGGQLLTVVGIDLSHSMGQGGEGEP